ncbi:hypothetical protein [Rhodanobacter sp. DHB23]|uniref:hypothetical protein n=1 Tax=Rhodanobacter sp. DHB23 TaxID=2775923 RepID=UPI0017859CCA|nr:hypothetical protein [Rhodanobacter sp. DHB23]MBD8874648.1 hypothetical protein [Rhodanobacter sp. DHB23]
MARDDWFRRTTWSDTEGQAFFARLLRSRTAFHKAQYLRIQAYTLAETRKKELIQIALELLHRLFAEQPAPSELASAHLQAALCYEQLGDLSSALNQFRLSLAAHSAYPNHDAGTALELSWFIAKHDLASHYDEALDVLEAAHLAFPVQFFKAAAVRAFVAQSRNQQQTALQHARKALEAAGLSQSQFHRHPSLGLVGPEYGPFVQRLSKLAAV